MTPAETIITSLRTRADTFLRSGSRCYVRVDEQLDRDAAETIEWLTDRNVEMMVALCVVAGALFVGWVGRW